MGTFIDENDCGGKGSVDSRSLEELIERILHKDILEKRNNVLKPEDNCGWQKEEEPY